MQSPISLNKRKDGAVPATFGKANQRANNLKLPQIGLKIDLMIDSKKVVGNHS